MIRVLDRHLEVGSVVGLWECERTIEGFHDSRSIDIVHDTERILKALDDTVFIVGQRGMFQDNVPMPTVAVDDDRSSKPVGTP